MSDDNTGNCQQCEKYKKIAVEIKESKKTLALKTKKILVKLKETKQKLDSKDDKLSKEAEFLKEKLKKVQDAGKKVVKEYESRLSSLKNIIRLNEEKKEEERNANETAFTDKIEKLTQESTVSQKELSKKYKEEIKQLNVEISNLKEKNNSNDSDVSKELKKYKYDIEQLKNALIVKNKEIDEYVLKENKKTIEAPEAVSGGSDEDNTAVDETNIEVAEAQIKNKDNNDNPNTNQKETFLSNLKNISEPITDIKLKLESSIMKNKTLELAYTEMKGKYDKLETNLSRKQDMLKKVADRYKEIQKRFKDTKTKLKKIETNLAEKKEEIIKRDKKISLMENEISERKLKSNEMKLQVEQLNQTNIELSSNAMLMKTGHEEHVKEIEEKMNAQWSARNKELVDKDDECLRLKKELADINANSDGWLNERDQLKGENDSLKQQISKLKDEYEKYQSKARIALKAQTDTEFEKTTGLNEQLKNMKEQNINLETNLATNKSKMKDLLHKLKSVKAKAKLNEHRVKDYEVEKQSLIDKLSNLDDNHSKYLNMLQEKILKELNRMDKIKNKLSTLSSIGVIRSIIEEDKDKNNNDDDGNHKYNENTPSSSSFGMDASIATKLINDVFRDNNGIDNSENSELNDNNDYKKNVAQPDNTTTSFGMDENVAKKLIDNLFADDDRSFSRVEDDNYNNDDNNNNEVNSNGNGNSHFMNNSSSRLLDMVVVNPLEGLTTGISTVADGIDSNTNSEVDGKYEGKYSDMPRNNDNSSRIAIKTKLDDEDDVKGQQEHLLLAAVNAAVRSTSTLDLLEKTDEKFIDARNDVNNGNSNNSIKTLSLQERYDVNKNELAQLKVEFEEMKQMNDLHLEQQEVLKEEIRELHRKIKRNETLLGNGNHGESRNSDAGDGEVGKNLNLEYLKKCVYQFMIADEPNERLTLVDPICTILKLSPSETGRVKKVANYEANAGVLSGVVNFFSPYTPTK